MSDSEEDVSEEESLPLMPEEVSQLRVTYARLKTEAMPLLREFVRIKRALEAVAEPLNALGERSQAILRAMGYTERAARTRVMQWRNSVE